jgi:hypothetical protein
VQFKVTDFETTYNAFIRRLTLTKFMTIPHYAYLILKMSGPKWSHLHQGDVKRAYNCDRESCEMGDMLLSSVELQDLKKALAESLQTPS